MGERFVAWILCAGTDFIANSGRTWRCCVQMALPGDDHLEVLWLGV